MTTLMLYNGSIYTLDPQQPKVQAIAIRAGRIIAAGSEGKVQAAVGGRAEGLNLQGRAVVPGLTDAHVHITWHGLAAQQVRLGATRSLAAALDLIAARAPALAPGAWLRGGGWNHLDWDGQWPRAADLDRVCPDRPAFLVRKDGHSAWVNSRALQLAGIDEHTPDPPGGQIQRDSDGNATGLLFETAMELVRAVIAPPTPAERLAALRAALAEALSYGLTSLHIPPGPNASDGRETLYDLKLLYERGELPLRCMAHLAAPDLDLAIGLGLRSGLGDDRLRIGGLKIFADGSLGSETAEMLTPYEGRRHTGMAMLPTEELRDLVWRANCAGFNVVVHAIGDAANRKVLDAIEQARGAMQAQGLIPPRLRNRIEHAQVLHAKDLPRFAALDVVASMQPIHATSDIEMADQLWGRRSSLAYAWRAVANTGAILAFGSDAPVETLDPWAGIHAAVTRQRPDSTPPGGWYPEQRLDLTAALAAYCVGPAITSGEEQQKGKLTPGMCADLAVLEHDIFQVDPAQLPATRVALTMVNGQVVFERGPAGRP